MNETISDKIPLVISMENIISSVIESKLGFPPYNVTYSVSSGLILSVTFYGKNDLSEFCKFASVTNLCDTSGFLIFQEYNTVILKDLIVKMFNQKLMEIVGDEVK